MSSEGGAEFSDFLEFLASKVRARQSELGGHQICNQLYSKTVRKLNLGLLQRVCWGKYRVVVKSKTRVDIPDGRTRTSFPRRQDM